MALTVGRIEFDNVDYDVGGDVLYLQETKGEVRVTLPTSSRLVAAELAPVLS